MKSVNPFKEGAYILLILVGGITLFFSTLLFLGMSLVSALFWILRLSFLSNFSLFIGLFYIFISLIILTCAFFVKHSRASALFGGLAFVASLFTFNTLIIVLTFVAFILSILS